MKARLYVLQHGAAVTKEEDAQRPLSNDGRLDVERVAQHLADKDVLVQRILHSGKLRAEQTAKLVSGKLAPDVEPEAVDGIAPNDDPAKFIEQLGHIEGAVLVASHMPFVSNLCSMLLTGESGTQFGFTPATIACVDYAGGQWSLQCMIRPEIL